ncbi:uncharacterized protein LOC133817592 isoform X2 [Humulus lupulus]|nr:uncharacterized protein LOC133817592 isoform X2 [Humulus lupulus]
MEVRVKKASANLLMFYWSFFWTLHQPLAKDLHIRLFFGASLYPEVLINLQKWYAHEYGDYLFTEKPHFFVGLVWLQLLVRRPHALLNIYAILASKSWFPITFLIYGASFLTSMVAVYWPFFGFAILAILRGLLPQSGKTASNVGKRPALPRKKRV